MIVTIACVMLCGCGPDYYEMAVSQKTKVTVNDKNNYYITVWMKKPNGGGNPTQFIVNKTTYEKYNVNDIIFSNKPE